MNAIHFHYIIMMDESQRSSHNLHIWTLWRTCGGSPIKVDTISAIPYTDNCQEEIRKEPDHG